MLELQADGDARRRPRFAGSCRLSAALRLPRRNPTRGRIVGAAILFAASLLATAARAQTPSWPSVWNSVGPCAENEPAGDKSPDTVDLVGSSGLPAAYFQTDSNFLYLRERVAVNPLGGSGLVSTGNWVVLLQTDSVGPAAF